MTSIPLNKKAETLLSREVLEQAMLAWTKHNEGIIGFEYISLLLDSGDLLDALDKVSTSMKIKQASFDDNDACLIWTSYMNMQEYGTPGFPLNESYWESAKEASC